MKGLKLPRHLGLRVSSPRIFPSFASAQKGGGKKRLTLPTENLRLQLTIQISAVAANWAALRLDSTDRSPIGGRVGRSDCTFLGQVVGARRVRRQIRHANGKGGFA